MSSQITDESLREAIKERLEAAHVEVTDMSGQYLSLVSLPREPLQADHGVESES